MKGKGKFNNVVYISTDAQHCNGQPITPLNIRDNETSM